MLIDRLNWRYATKKFDPARKVEEAVIARILEAVRLAPSSSGLQPYQVIVVRDPSLRAAIRPHAWDQAQVTEASHLIVFAAWDDYTAERINLMFDLVNETRGFVNPGWEKYRKFILSTYVGRSPEVNHEHAARQAYIGLGVALLACAEAEVDATPMEGFSPEKVDEILGLTERGLRSVLLLPVGYRQAEGDWLVNLEKVRRSRENFVIEM